MPMPTAMIERVQWAIDNAKYSSDYWAQARAAIAAMREPTEAMIKAGEKIYARCIWQAMIDAALEEK